MYDLTWNDYFRIGLYLVVIVFSMWSPYPWMTALLSALSGGLIVIRVLRVIER